MHKDFLSSTASLKKEIKIFNNIAIKGNPRWLLKQERLETAYTLLLF